MPSLAPSAGLDLLLGDIAPSAGLELRGVSALPDRGTAGIGSLLGEHDKMQAYALDLMRRRAAGDDANTPVRPEMPSIGSLIPPELRDRLPSAELMARLLLGSLPGSGDYMAAQDAVEAGRAGISALGGGDYWRAGARGVDAMSGLLGTLPFVPYVAGMAGGVGKAARQLPYHLQSGIELPTPHNPRGLPMDNASRMRRAKEMGFTIDAYHGSPSPPFRSFDPEMYGSSTGYNRGTEAGAWFTDNRGVADAYRAIGLGEGKLHSVGGHVLDAKLRLESPHVYDVKKEARNLARETGLPYKKLTEEEALGVLGASHVRVDVPEGALGAGRDGVIFKNMADDPASSFGGTTRPSTHYVIFDPRNVRAREATFDPERSDSSDLLASLAAWLALGGAAGIGSLGLSEEGM